MKRRDGCTPCYHIVNRVGSAICGVARPFWTAHQNDDGSVVPYLTYGGFGARSLPSHFICGSCERVAKSRQKARHRRRAALHFYYQ